MIKMYRPADKNQVFKYVFKYTDNKKSESKLYHLFHDHNKIFKFYEF